MKKLTSLIEKKKWIQHTIAAVIVFCYTVAFCVLSFSPTLGLSSISEDDIILQRGVDFSDDVCIIEISPADVAYFQSDVGTIASRVALTLNSRIGTPPAAINVDVPLQSLSADAESNLLRAAAYHDNIVLPVDLSVNSSCVIGRFDISETDITAHNVFLPSDALAQSCSLSHNEKILDNDGILRHAVFDIPAKDGTVYSSMAYVSYEMFCETNRISLDLPQLSAQNTAVIKFSSRDQVVSACSAKYLINGLYDISNFANKIVFIICRDNALDTDYLTAIDHQRSMSSGEIDANITSALLTGSFALGIHPAIQTAVLVAAILLLIYFAFTASPLFSVCVGVLYVLLERVLAMLLYGVGHIGYSVPHIVNALLTCVLFGALSYAQKSVLGRKKLENALGKYVDDSIAQNIIQESQSGEEVLQSDLHNVSIRKIAVLFADIRNFTAFSEKYPADQIVSILNSYLSMMSDCINKYGGTVDKFIGDCAMGYWGAPIDDDDAVYHACLAAAEMQRRAAELAATAKRTYHFDIKVGIGINYGEAMVGNIGSSDRMNFTVIGDSVNTASRLESLAPGGMIYLSDAALEMLGNRVEVECLPETTHLKGKEKAISVYSLKSISAQEARKQKAAAKKSKETSGYSYRGFVAVLTDIILLVTLFISNINGLREFGIEFPAYFTMALSIVSLATVALLIPYDIQAMNRADGVNVRPHWLDVLLLTGLVSQVQTVLLLLINVVPESGLRAFLGNAWSGGVMVYVICPLLCLYSFFCLESTGFYRVFDPLIAILPLAGLQLLFGSVVLRIGLDHANPDLYQAFYSLPSVIVSIASELLISYLLCFIVRRSNLQERIWGEYFGKKDLSSESLRQLPIAHFFADERRKLILLLSANLLVAVLSLRVTVRSYRAGGIDIYSNPSLVGIIVAIMCVISEFYLVGAYRSKTTLHNTPLYKYFSFVKMLGCQINFISVFMLAISGEGIRALFEPRWYADATVFLLCPIITLLMCLREQNDYSIYKCTLSAVPFALIPTLSKSAIVSSGLSEQYYFEYTTFYNTQEIIVVTVGELLFGMLFCMVISICVKLSRSDNMPMPLTICGSRSDITAGLLPKSEYGLRSDCYVLRDGNYALVINAGSGLVNAKKLLIGCERVDILITTAKITALMGLLEVNNLCPSARIRIFSAFDLSGFSAKPFWPVDMTERYHCKQVSPNRKIRLNSDYSVVFVPLEEGKRSFMLKITGAASIGFIGRATLSPERLRSLAMGSELLIYNGYTDNNINACYLAIDCNIPSLLISGYTADLDDAALHELQKNAEKILPEVTFAREGLVFPVRRN